MKMIYQILFQEYIDILLDGHDLLLQVEPVRRPLEAGDLLVLSLHHPTHLLHLSSEILPTLSTPS